jgi:hypothetical protein
MVKRRDMRGRIEEERAWEDGWEGREAGKILEEVWRGK